VLEIARGNRPDFFNLHYVKPPPFVPRYLRRELPGRLTHDGRERRPLDRAQPPVGGLPGHGPGRRPGRDRRALSRIADRLGVDETEAARGVRKLAPARMPCTGRTLEDARKGRRPVDYATEGVHDADLYVGELLEPGTSFDGPAIVESRSSTVVVPPANRVRVDEYGSIVISIRPLA
jgi:N-methylhydantoinase A/oxoprolinase/acetone carboxylase beta subunit